MNHPAAARAFEQALAIRLRVFASAPEDLELQEPSFNSHFSVGVIRLATGDRVRAIESFRAAQGYPLPGRHRSALQLRKDAELATLLRRVVGPPAVR